MEVLHISCNMGTRDLPDMYALSPRASGHTYQTNPSCPCMLQLIHVTYHSLYHSYVATIYSFNNGSLQFACQNNYAYGVDLHEHLCGTLLYI